VRALVAELSPAERDAFAKALMPVIEQLPNRCALDATPKSSLKDREKAASR
jgi:hypothetical protein